MSDDATRGGRMADDLLARADAGKWATDGEAEDLIRDLAAALREARAERDALRKDIEQHFIRNRELRAEHDRARMDAAKTGEREAVNLSRIQDLMAERDRANADAARYRWLRDGDGPQSSRWSRWRIEHWSSPGPTWADIRGADLDAAIDAHLKGKP